MAEFEDALNSLLSDPQAMGQILALAGKLGGQTEPPSPDQAPPPVPPPPPEEPEMPDLAQMGRLLSLLQAREVGTPEARALLDALRPFLKPERQRKLDRALRLAGFSQVARQALQLWKEGELHV
jgi:hypothetical protein